jgi:hypothetical protein
MTDDRWRMTDDSGGKAYVVPPLWDGRAAERIWEVLLK